MKTSLCIWPKKYYVINLSAILKSKGINTLNKFVFRFNTKDNAVNGLSSMISTIAKKS